MTLLTLLSVLLGLICNCNTSAVINKVDEVLTLPVGQCGIQLDQKEWEHYCAEHGVTVKGDNPEASVIVEHTGTGQYVPRNCMVDLEPNFIDDVKNSKYSAIAGHYTVGKEMINTVQDRLRKLVDNADNVQGFIISHAVGGGTGSGLGALILERIAVDYRKKSKIGFEIYPSPTISTCIVEPYNAMLSTHWLLDHTEVSVVLDNEAIYKICQKNLDIKRPSYDNLNRLITKVISSMTASLRFEGELNVDLNEFQTNLVPFKKKFPTVSKIINSVAQKTGRIMNNHDLVSAITGEFGIDSFYAAIDETMGFNTPSKANYKIVDTEATIVKSNTRIIAKGNDKTIQPITQKLQDLITVAEGTTDGCTVKGFSVTPTGAGKVNVQAVVEIDLQKVADFDVEADKYMAISVDSKKANAAVQWMKTNKKVCAVEWVPTGLGLNKEEAATVEEAELGFEKNAVMIGNNVAISRVFSERISKKYDLMYSQRAFVHWYVGEGMEEGR